MLVLNQCALYSNVKQNFAIAPCLSIFVECFFNTGDERRSSLHQDHSEKEFSYDDSSTGDHVYRQAFCFRSEQGLPVRGLDAHREEVLAFLSTKTCHCSVSSNLVRQQTRRGRGAGSKGWSMCLTWEAWDWFLVPHGTWGSVDMNSGVMSDSNTNTATPALKQPWENAKGKIVCFACGRAGVVPCTTGPPEKP